MRKSAVLFILLLLLFATLPDTLPAAAKKAAKITPASATTCSEVETIGSDNSPAEKINLVWQHDSLPAVDLSVLPKVPGVNVVSPCWYVISNEYGKINSKAVEGYVARAHAKGYKAVSYTHLTLPTT